MIIADLILWVKVAKNLRRCKLYPCVASSRVKTHASLARGGASLDASLDMDAGIHPLGLPGSFGALRALSCIRGMMKCERK